MLTGCSRTTAARQGPSAGGNTLAPLNAAVRSVNEARTALVSDLSAVQRAASALDATDEACATGSGSAARDAHRSAGPAVQAAPTAIAHLAADVTAYTAALNGLEAAQTAAPAARGALSQAVASGHSEAAATTRFQAAAAAAWPQYAQLDRDESTWITRALTPWYRSASEGANAYAVLVGDTRAALDAARADLAAASERSVAASAATSSALRAADAALSTLRTPG